MGARLRIAPSAVALALAITTFGAAHAAVGTRGQRQSVAIRTQLGSQISAVSITMDRG
jgi:hypothetical protein